MDPYIALAQALLALERAALPPECELNASDARVLITIVRWRGEDALSLSQLGEQAGLEASLLSKLLTRLERGGWLRRKFCTKDRRVRRVWLTRKGLTLAQQLDASSQQAWAALEAQLGDDLDQTRALMSKLLLAASSIVAST